MLISSKTLPHCYSNLFEIASDEMLFQCQPEFQPKSYSKDLQAQVVGKSGEALKVDLVTVTDPHPDYGHADIHESMILVVLPTLIQLYS